VVSGEGTEQTPGGSTGIVVVRHDSFLHQFVFLHRSDLIFPFGSAQVQEKMEKRWPKVSQLKSIH